jgi:hypothetical protein
MPPTNLLRRYGLARNPFTGAPGSRDPSRCDLPRIDSELMLANSARLSRHSTARHVRCCGTTAKARVR